MSAWQKAARWSLKQGKLRAAQWPYRELLFTCAMEGDTDAATELQQRLRAENEKAIRNRSKAGKAAGDSKRRRIEQRVLARLADMTRAGKIPPARNLVAALIKHAGLRRNSTRGALGRLAAEGRLPEEYVQHFCK